MPTGALAGSSASPSPAVLATELTQPSAEKTSSSGWDWNDQGEVLSQEEIWDIAYIGGTKVGYEHTVVEKRRRSDQVLTRIVQKQLTKIRRFSETVQMTLELESWQTPDGKLLAFRGKQEQGISPIEFDGWVDGSTLIINQRIHGRTSSQKIAWDSSYGGFRAVEESLRKRPIQPGQRWSVQYLMPVFNVVAQTDLEVKGPETVRLLSGNYELVRVDIQTRAASGIELTGTLWVDQSGEILKSVTNVMNLETYRGSREEALAESSGVVLDWGEDIRVPATGLLERPHETTMARYRAVLADGDAARLFAVGPSQRVRRQDDGAAEITVYAIRPGSPLPVQDGFPEDPPTDADRQPGTFIQSDYPAIVELAAKWTANINTPWEMAVALEKSAYQWVTNTNYKVGLASAAEVVDSRQGDCTEHAVLLAALARAKNIPARVAMGLVYNKGAFYYHMWTEVWIDGVWYPLDATLARGGIGAAHLKMAASSLEGPAALARMFPLMQVLGKLRIEILEARYGKP